MRKKVNQIICGLLAAVIVLSVNVFVSDAAEDKMITVKGSNSQGVGYTVEIDKSSITMDSKAEQVVVTVKANKNITLDSIGGDILIPDGITLTGVENEQLAFAKNIDYNLETGKLAYATADAENKNADLLVKLTYSIPSTMAPGKYELGIAIDCISKNYGSEVWENNVEAIIPLTIEGEAHIHTLNKVEAKEAGCKQAGNNEYWLCSICGQAFKDKDAKNSTTVQNETIEKLAHTWSEWKNENNIKTRTCTVCGEKETESESENANGPSRFRDVIEGSYYCDAVNWAVGAGVTSGTSAENFSPDMACSRAQAVTFLYRAAGSPDPAGDKQPFLDVDEGTYYYNAVLWAVENGITTGTSETTFSPDAVCSRAQIVTFLWRAQGSPKADTANPFSDVKTDAYYGAPVLWAVENGITSGTSATTFSPNTNCSRAQIVTFLYRNYVK